MTAFGGLLVTGLDFVAILLMFSQVDVLGGYGLPEVAFLYGLSATSFGLADLAVGSMDRLGSRVRDGTLDTLLVRPVPVLAQVAADRFALRRVARITQGALVLGYGTIKFGLQTLGLAHLMQTTANPTSRASVDSVQWGLKGASDGEADRKKYLPGSTPAPFNPDFVKTGSSLDDKIKWLADKGNAYAT